MQCESGTRPKLSRHATCESDEPAFRVLTVCVDVQYPVVVNVPDQLPDQVNSARNPDVLTTLRRSWIDIKYTALVPGHLHACVGAPDVYGYPAVRRRIRADKKHFHQ